MIFSMRFSDLVRRIVLGIFSLLLPFCRLLYCAFVFCRSNRTL